MQMNETLEIETDEKRIIRARGDILRINERDE